MKIILVKLKFIQHTNRLNQRDGILKKIDRILFLIIALISISTSYYSIFIKYDKKIFLILKPGENICINNYFNFISPFINNTYNSYVFIYLNDICFSCPSGELVKLVEVTSDLYKNIDFIILLSNEYTSNDIDNLVYNYSLNLKFKLVDKNLQKLIDSKQKIHLAILPEAFAFLVNPEGVVIDVAEINLKNWHRIMHNWRINL